MFLGKGKRKKNAQPDVFYGRPFLLHCMYIDSFLKFQICLNLEKKSKYIIESSYFRKTRYTLIWQTPF